MILIILAMLTSGNSAIHLTQLLNKTNISQNFIKYISTIDNNLKMNGYFIGTMFDGELISNLVKETEQFELVDDDKVRFRIKSYGKLSKSLFGNKLSVFLNETVLDEPMDEYVVYFDLFVNEMRKRGYELVESKVFNEEYNTKYNLNDLEKRISFLNRSFVFKRTGDILTLPQVCVEETDYLIECKWPSSKKDKLIEKYKKALSLKAQESNGILKEGYIYLMDNFERAEELIDDQSLDAYLRNYLKDIYEIFKKQLK
jgi:hypothetical protein